MKYLLRFTLCIFFCLNALMAQRNDVLVQLTDGKTEEPISFATVRIKNSDQPLIAGFGGEYRIPSSFLKKDQVLVITSIGYRTLEIKTNKLLPDVINRFSMQQQIEVLETVVIETKQDRDKTVKVMKSTDDLNAKAIVAKAISRIPLNLPSHNYSILGYYWDYQISENTYYNSNEANLEVFDRGIVTNAIQDPENTTQFWLNSPLNKQISH